MPAHRSIPMLRTTRLRKTATAALATAGAAALALTAVPVTDSAPASAAAAALPGAKSADLPGQGRPAEPAAAQGAVPQPRADLAPVADSALAEAVAVQHAVAEGAAETARQQAAERAERAEAERLAAEERAEAQAASRAAERQETAAPAAEPVAEAPAAEPEPEPEPVYTDDLDGWIREALDIMAEKGIPGTYEGLHRNIMRESSGDPNAINLWDINAINGTPSIGLLQVIQPTFDAYHVEGTPYDLYDPVANLTAAANYAADRYGSIDNVNGPY